MSQYIRTVDILVRVQVWSTSTHKRYTCRKVPTNFPRTGPSFGSSFGWFLRGSGAFSGGGLVTILFVIPGALAGTPSTGSSENVVETSKLLTLSVPVLPKASTTMMTRFVEELLTRRKAKRIYDSKMRSSSGTVKG
jgi:hypothetical protein